MDREIGKEIFHFFNEKVVLRYSNLDVNVTETLINRNKAFLLRALQIADSDIIDIRVEKEKVTQKAVSYNLLTNSTGLSDKTGEVLKIKTYHRSGEKVKFDFDTEESDGTRKMFAIIYNIKNDRHCQK
jgi:hypothetical protein